MRHLSIWLPRGPRSGPAPAAALMARDLQARITYTCTDTDFDRVCCNSRRGGFCDFKVDFT